MKKGTARRAKKNDAHLQEGGKGLTRGAAQEPASALLARLKASLELLGIITASGGSFAALSLGIGYLATARHNLLIGIPTTAVDPETFVRTGSLFFSNSLFHIFSSNTPFVLLLLLVAGGLHIGLRRQYVRQPVVAIGIQLGACAVAVIVLSLEFSVLDPMNKNLLYQMVDARNDPNHQAAQASPVSLADALWTTEQDPTSVPLRLNATLQSLDGRATLQRLYGEIATVVALLVFATWTIQRTTHSGSTTSVRLGYWGLTMDSASRFALYSVMIGVLFNLPGVYGVLALPTEAAQVLIWSAGADGALQRTSGALLTDLSSGSPEVWVLGDDQQEPDENRIALSMIERSTLRSITLVGKVTPNILAVGSTHDRSSVASTRIR